MTLTTNPDYLGLLAGVLEAPDDDAPRVVLADWLEENGDTGLAEFIRVQLELSAGKRKTNRLRIQRRFAKLMSGAITLRRHKWLNYFLDELKWGLSVDGWGYCVVPIEPHVKFRRGFVHVVTCTAEAFLAHADALLWRPGEACRGRGGSGKVRGEADEDQYACAACGEPAGLYGHWDGKKMACPPPRLTCPACRGTGRRPCPPTAQPIESVMLTTWPLPDYNMPPTPHERRFRFPLREWLTFQGEWRGGPGLLRTVALELLRRYWPQVKLENWKLPGD